MRRLVVLLALAGCAVAAALAACGGGDDESTGPLGAALAFMPPGTPFVLALDTDLDGERYEAVDSILGKFPIGVESVEGLLEEQLENSSSIDFERDVKPLLGNPFLIGGSDARSFVDTSESSDFIAAAEVADPDALDELIERTEPDEIGEVAGATKYEDGGTVFAVKDDVVVLAGTDELLDGALERAGGDDHLDEETFEEGLVDLPGEALARVYVNVERLVAADPDSAAARRIPWVDALRTLGITADARRGELEVEFNLRTDPEGLDDGDLPVAAGEDSPPVVRREGEIGVGIRDPAQIVAFAEAAGQALDPAGFGDYARAKKALDSQLGISIDDDLVGQLTGNLSASLSLDGGFGVRSELRDVAAFERTLAKVADVLPEFAEGAGLGTVAIEKPEAGNPFYALAQPDGDAVVFGVVDDVFVMADDPGRAGELAAGGTEPVAGAKGALAMSSDAEQLANAAVDTFADDLGLEGLGPFGAKLFTGPLGELSGSVESSAGGMRGRARLEIE